MKTYLIPLIPGPTRVSAEVLAAYQTDYGSSDLELDFFELYQDTAQKIQTVLGTQNKVALMTGEAMVTLWGALRSSLSPGDKVLAVANGVYGYGIANMARLIGCEVAEVGFDYDQSINVNLVENKIKEFHPKMVTMVHCETPSGILNPVEEVGRLIKQHDVPIFYVDAVSSGGGTEVKVDDWSIDLCMLGSQKCLSAPPDLGIITISERVWKIINYIDYHGYDALSPWENALEKKWFPYTLSWHSIAAVNKSCQMILDEGLKNVFERHNTAAQYCRQRIKDMKLNLFPVNEKDSSPTVTAIKLPEKIDWLTLNRKLRARGMAVGGSLEKLTGNVFRIGHMGQQANMGLLEHGMDILEYVLLAL